MAEVMEPVFEKQEQVNNYKGNGIKWLFVGAMEVLEKDKERLGVMNEQLKAKQKSQRASLAVSRLTSCSQRQNLSIKPRT